MPDHRQRHSKESVNTRHSGRVLHTPAQGGLLSSSCKVLLVRPGTGLKSQRRGFVYASIIGQFFWGTPVPHSSWPLSLIRNALGPRHTTLNVFNSGDITQERGSPSPKSTEDSKSSDVAELRGGQATGGTNRINCALFFYLFLCPFN